MVAMQPHKSFANITDCKDLVQCAFSLNEFEIEVYKSAAAHGPIRADDLADRMGRDRSTVYRALIGWICGPSWRDAWTIGPSGCGMRSTASMSRCEPAGGPGPQVSYK